MDLQNTLGSLTTIQNYKSRRISSYDTTGANKDAWVIGAWETRILGEIEGSGQISHIWSTILSGDLYYLRNIVLRMYWDDEENPSVETPIGDFFGLGHAKAFTYENALFSTSTHGEGMFGNFVAMNSWIQMPFKKHARIEITNESAISIDAFYFYIDYRLYDSLPGDIVYFHANWRRENPCKIPDDDGGALKEQMLKGNNLTDKYNYLILEAEGNGHFIGVNFSIDNLNTLWWGEGDDMVFIDRDGERTWPPEMHGTGSEDYLCQAWGMQKVNHQYSGMPYWEDLDFVNKGKVCVYRYHIADPIPFQKNIRISIEHGHANDRTDDYASTAYWYQTEPHKVFVKFPSAADRLPRVKEDKKKD